MASIASVGGVGAGLSQAAFQVQHQVTMLKEQQQVSNSLGAIALELMRSAMTAPATATQGHDLDVKA